VKPEEEVPKLFSADAICYALLFSIVRSVFKESKFRLAEERVKFRRSIAERMMNCPEHKMNNTVNLLKLDESFRAAWNTWLGTPLNGDRKKHSKCLRAVYSSPKGNWMTKTPRDEETETFLNSF